MFEGCNLDYSSISNIANTLPPVESGDIHIGNINDVDKDYENIESAIATIERKGWTVTK
jgi:hypothetical protein